MREIQSAEAVCQGHPDKIADQISDAILDELIKKDPYAKTAIETLITTGVIYVSGEISTDSYVDIPNIARNVLIDIGYIKPEYGFDGYTAGVITSINDQSPEISMGIPLGKAGDTSIVVGYATNETKNYMPIACNIANSIVKRIDTLRKEDIVDFFRPDGKAIAVVEYEDGQPKRVDSLTVLVQHEPYVSEKQLKEAIIEEVIKKEVPENLIDDKTKIIINPLGRFIIGGPMADTGLTGRKTIADAYGTAVPSGGSAFSGKDPTKIDRSASYMTRYIAKHIVASGICNKCKIELVYIIGMDYPISIDVKIDNKDIDKENLIKKIEEIFDLSPAGIIENLKLRKPIYKKSSIYGHFGKEDEEFEWEQLNKNILEGLKNV
ncbi:methionine adenosyltransferase [Hydrogenothermus marinus]|uniref:Methionine adenosyltransferase n=1 Tax=Hydrogenothermus marinus TaxID=133270 RepID=A0A3M0BIE7_9AQUI|nr:methionine adenosyltransferase [Hydrogenothermus marinus]RMA96099.1 methionine adenosyltransferase [Hydrogenothermus marinus]